MTIGFDTNNRDYYDIKRAEREVERKDLEYMGENERLGNRSGCRKFDKEMGR